MRRTFYLIILVIVFLLTGWINAFGQTCDTNQQVIDENGGIRIAWGTAEKTKVNGKDAVFLGKFGWTLERETDPSLRQLKPGNYEVWFASAEYLTTSDVRRPRLYGRLIQYIGKDEPKWNVDRVFELSLGLGFVMSQDSCLTSFLNDNRQQMVNFIIRPEFKQP